MTSERSPFATPTERLATYFDCAQPRDTFEDRDIDDIATLLEQCGHIASKCPRTYILFRRIGQPELVERLVNAGFSDQFFPVEARSLPTFLDLSVIQAVVQQQGIILTKSLDLENGRHRHFTPGETLPFEILGRLGSGGYGQVDRILSRTSFKQYALKRIRRRAAFGNQSSREAVKGFLNEMKILKRLEHRHIVQYIGSYTDKSYLGLVMSPIAETDLASYNTRLCGFLQAIQADKWSIHSQDQPVAAEMSSNMRTFYGCLAAALGHLHEQNIRHKDIKPQNILVAKGNVLFTDFGLSRDFADDVGSTTSGVTPASARYCAPEVANYEARNTSSDIWSLGCVFLEMTAALQGLNVEWIKQFFLQSGSEGTHFHNNPAATVQLIEKLKDAGDSRDQRTLTWIEKMVIPHRGTRFTAAQVIETITSPDTSDGDVTPNMFCGICCVPDLESDSLDSLADDFDVVTAISLPNHALRRISIWQPQANDPQLEAQTKTKLKTSNEPLVPDTHTSKVSTSAATIRPTKPRTSDPQSSNAASSATAISNTEPSQKNPDDRVLEIVPVSATQTIVETDNAKDLLRGPMEGENVLEDNESLLQKNDGDQVSSLNAGRPEMSPVSQVQAGRSTSALDNKHHEASSYSSKASAVRDAVVAELLADGITENQIKKYSAGIDEYVDSSPSLKVMGMPLWITTRFAGVERSAYADLDHEVEYACVVPIIVAECCTMITSQTGQRSPFDKLTSLNLDFFKASAGLEPWNQTAGIRSLCSDFSEHPSFGRGVLRPECSLRDFGVTLLTYLSSLPEPLVLPSILRKMTDKTNIPTGSVQIPTQPNDLALQYTIYILELPRANCETLIYLLLFLDRITAAKAEISKMFQPAIIRADPQEEDSAISVLKTMIQNVHTIIKNIPGAKPIPNTTSVEPVTLQTPSEHGTSPSPLDLVVARYDCFRPLTKNDLSFVKGDVIRVISRIGNRDGLWCGELRGEISLFVGSYTRPYDPERDRDRLNKQQQDIEQQRAIEQGLEIQAVEQQPSSLLAQSEQQQKPEIKRINLTPQPKTIPLGRGFRATLHGLFDK